jgi:hypothetical protein
VVGGKEGAGETQCQEGEGQRDREPGALHAHLREVVLDQVRARVERSPEEEKFGAIPKRWFGVGKQALGREHRSCKHLLGALHEQREECRESEEDQESGVGSSRLSMTSSDTRRGVLRLTITGPG